MTRLFLLLLMMLYVVSCKPIQEITKKHENSKESHASADKEYIEKKDTTFNYTPSPERSENRYNSDSSYLETSLAYSIAKLVDGVLIHSIQNKSDIPIRVPSMIYISFKERRDSVASDDYVMLEHTVVKEKYRLFNAFFYTSGWGAWILLIITIIITIWRKRRK